MPSPFLDVKSFETQELAAEAEARETFEAPASHFLSVYGYEEGEPVSDPVTEEHAEFLSELYDEEMNEALAGLVAEAANLADSRGVEEDETGYDIEPLLRQHFAPLAHEAEALISHLASALANRDPAGITESEIDHLVDDHPLAANVSPAFEDFLKKIKKTVKKVAKKAVNVAKKGVAAVAKLGLGPVLNKLKALVQPLLNRVLDKAIGKLPEAVQPIATQLAEKLGIIKRELAQEAESAPIAALEVAEIQLEFVENTANLLFAPSEVEQDLELVQARSRSRGPARFPIADLDRARRKLVGKLSRLKEGEDPTPHIEEFVPAILPALKVGIQLAGRKRVVNFLAGLLAKLIQKYIGPQYAPALSQAMVDVGLRLIGLEVSEDDEAQAGSAAVAATIEDTVRRVAALPDHVLDHRPLLQAYAIEAFEAAAAANLPPVLPERVYRNRPDLRPGGATCGAWLTLPPGNRRKRFKKFSRVIRAKLTPHKVETVPGGDAEPLSEFLEDEFDLDPGEEFEARVHLYETLPGAGAVDLARTPREQGGLGSAAAVDELHTLTPHAAALLVGEPALGLESADDDPTAAERGRHRLKERCLQERTANESTRHRSEGGSPRDSLCMCTRAFGLPHCGLHVNMVVETRRCIMATHAINPTLLCKHHTVYSRVRAYHKRS